VDVETLPFTELRENGNMDSVPCSKTEVRCQAYDRIYSFKILEISAVFPHYLPLQHSGLQYEKKPAVGSDGRFGGCDQNTEIVFRGIYIRPLFRRIRPLFRRFSVRNFAIPGRKREIMNAMASAERKEGFSRVLGKKQFMKPTPAQFTACQQAIDCFIGTLFTNSLPD